MAACYGSCPMGEKRKLHNAGSPQAREVGSSCCRWRVSRSGIWGLLSPNVKIVALRLLGDVNPMTAASSGVVMGTRLEVSRLGLERDKTRLMKIVSQLSRDVSRDYFRPF